ncbi:Uncharacterized protein TCM_003172 [Theobroma cacao]|uniref:Uncharacterized protein n=1 Tax=Theobroma cacao TaxID=3641 RepID=A0A061DN04_THECC|nr:Uncharacterized protein TCM_003172 [Theobroma cacao]
MLAIRESGETYYEGAQTAIRRQQTEMRKKDGDVKDKSFILLSISIPQRTCFSILK